MSSPRSCQISGGSADDGPDGEVEVIQQSGEIQKVIVRCRCGKTHELDLVGDAPAKEGGES